MASYMVSTISDKWALHPFSLHLYFSLQFSANADQDNKSHLIEDALPWISSHAEN